MNISIAPPVFARLHPTFTLILLHARDLDNRSKVEESIHLLKEVENVIRLTFNRETLKNHMLLSPWNVAQQEFGKDARHYQTSVEHLIQQVLRGKEVSTKTTITNLVRYLSLKHILPLAADDIHALKGDIQFDVVQGKTKIGFLRRLKKGDVYYRDAARILGAKLDYWKNQKTTPTPDTKEVLIHLEILPPVSKKQQERVIGELQSLIETFCNGKVKTYALHRTKKKVVVK
ncbi:hypothetical protein HY496_00510 [Candidatus Woesearchaeota archaeon]|nr:hypothetical protein [Candidatus Woesearchaeota archaeon]